MSKVSPLTPEQILDCRRILKAYPLFSNFSSEDLNEFSAMFFSQEFKFDETITNEGDLIDSVYFLVQGKTEVRKRLPGTTKSMPIATLVPNDAIGLSYTGYYSKTGKRSASIIALSDILLYGINIRELNIFIAKHNQFKENLKQYSQLLLRMHFIKEIAPFSELNVDQLTKYANSVEEVFIPKGQIIFNEGEEGKKGYLICDGKVEILIGDTKNDLEQIAVLESPNIFGETALLMQTPRNATVRTMTDCLLLEVNTALFAEMLKDKNTAETLKNIIYRRRRPQPAKNIEIYNSKHADGAQIYILKEPVKGNYCRLTQESWFIWQQLDGKKSLRDITNAYFNHFHVFNPGLILSVIDEFERLGFVIDPHLAHARANLHVKNSWQMTVFTNLKKIMEIKVFFHHVDPFITKLYSSGIYLLYSKWMQVFWGVLSVIGIYFFCIQSTPALTTMKSIGGIKWLLLAATIPAGILIAILHELAHAMTTKYYGQVVKSFGLGWLWFGPIAFCDTSDMWLCTRWPRVIVDLSGMYLQMILAAVAAITAMFVSSEHLRLYLWFFSLYNYLLIYWNLTPILDFDGYYALMDWLDDPNLRVKSITWLIDKLPKEYRQTNFIRTYKNEIIYWGVCVIFLILELLVPYFILKYLLNGFLGVSNPLYSFIPALLVVILSVIAIWYEVKQARLYSNLNRD